MKNQLTVTFNNFLDSFKDHVGEEITAVYTATLNKNAAVGIDPNTNKVKVEYSNTEASKGTVVAPTGTDKDAKGVSITDMKSGEKGTLVVTFTDKNGVVTTSTIDYQYN